MSQVVRCCEDAGSPEDIVIARLEEAGRCLLALPHRGHSTAMRGFWPEIVRDAIEAYGWDGAAMKPAVPAARVITRMDEALGWIGLIHESRYVLRKIVGARALVSPVSGRYVYTWRGLGSVLGADHRAVQRWHAEGIGIIVRRLRCPKDFFTNA